ncbi:MAG: hypothetical protein U1E17_05170 [Geminicoccaceae bacterium]
MVSCYAEVTRIGRTRSPSWSRPGHAAPAARR